MVLNAIEVMVPGAGTQSFLKSMSYIGLNQI